jgi:type IX secretion system substrate protein
MKRILLIVLVFGIGFSSFAQKHILRSTKAPNTELQLEKAPQSPGTAMTTGDTPEVKTQEVNGRSVDYIPIGVSGNAYGYYGNSRTYVWADPNVNSIVFTHRMTGGVEVEGNSRIAYDVSTDGGATWINNVQVYTPTAPGPQYPDNAGRYPQGAIINPVGNTNPDMAYYTYLAAAINNTNGIWGAYAYGSNVLTETDPPNPTQNLLESGNGYTRLIPDALTVTTQGVSWYIEPSTDYTSGTAAYTGEIIVGKGEIVDGEIVYEESLIEFLEEDDAFNDSKIAFGPDGLTGYMVLMSDSESDPQSYTSYHPILLKTTDGGNSWSDANHVILGGTDGIESIKSYWPTETIESIDFYGPGFDRDEVYYNMGFHVDIIVDINGNPHITGIIAIGTDDGWYPGEGTMATWHLYSEDGGTTWDADALYDNLFFEGIFGAVNQHNRPYASSTYDGHYLFFSWLDTDLDGAEANTNPNIFVIGYDAEDNTYNTSGVQNVTELSLYWFSAFYGSMTQYVFSELNDDEDMWDCEIPFVFTEFTVPGDDTQEMNFYYIDGYTLPMAVGVDTQEGLAGFAVSQNSPNPAVNSTNIHVTSEKAGVISLSLTNMLGQIVQVQSVDNSALAHTFNVDVSNLDSGIYFYTVEIGTKSVTKKMIVK